MEQLSSLAGLDLGQGGRVASVEAEGAMRRRLLDLGLIPGTPVTCVARSPAGDPSAYLVRGTVIALRRRDAAGVVLERAACPEAVRFPRPAREGV